MNYADIAKDYQDAEARLTDAKRRMQGAKITILAELLERMSLRQIARKLKRSPRHIDCMIDGYTHITLEEFSALIKIHTKEFSNEDPCHLTDPYTDRMDM